MPLWVAALLFVILAVILIVTLFSLRKKGSGRARKILFFITGMFCILLAVYILLTFLLLNGSRNRPPDKEKTTGNTVISSTAETPSTTEAPSVPSSDLPEKVPAQHPDPLKIRDLTYEPMPVLHDQNEISLYILHQMMTGQMDIEFYIPEDLEKDEGSRYHLLYTGCLNASSYYLFSAYREYNMYTEDRGDEEGIYAKITLQFTHPKRDKKARQTAWDFIREHPVPEGGFTSFKEERAYAEKIHDYIINKISYSPIGYDPKDMLQSDNYRSKQEAWNVLNDPEQTAVCAGYARAFALISQYAGIDCAWVWGNETEESSHAWNILYPCDGSDPVLIDATWDDTGTDSTEDDAVSYQYFYLPLTEDTEHSVDPEFDEFLTHLHS